MKTVFVTVTDSHFFPGTAATINSVLHFHPAVNVVVVNNHIQKTGLSALQTTLLNDNGVMVVDAAQLRKPGRKLAAWELKAYAASDLTDGYDVLVGIDSDCVLCGSVEDVIAEAAQSGKFHGGWDGHQTYDNSYSTYGIEVPDINEKYMSTSLYFCALSDGNRTILNEWSSCCDKAIFGGGGVYPGHGDQGVLNALIYKHRGSDGVGLLDNSLWSQHHCYWQTKMSMCDGGLFNESRQAWQRAIHCGGTDKFWRPSHYEKLLKHPQARANYAWFLSFLWSGKCAVEVEHLLPEHFHLIRN